jgi:hypothetical protein
MNELIRSTRIWIVGTAVALRHPGLFIAVDRSGGTRRSERRFRGEPAHRLAR